ncbi:MAG: hypothetical protein AAFV80_20760 [Bacteroidota bacterium]
MRLYEFLAGQKVFDRQKLEKKFRKEKWFKNYSRTRNYLFDLLMRALRSYNAGKDLKDQIYEKIQNAKILHDKGLLDQAYKLVKKIKTNCYELEEFNLLLELLEFQRILNWEMHKGNDEVNDERAEVLQKLINITKFFNIYQQFLKIIMKSDNWVDDSEMQRAHELIQNPLLQDEERALSINAKLNFNSTQALYNHLIKKYDQCVINVSRVAELYDQNPAFKRANVKNYFWVLGNLITMCYHAYDKVAFNQTVERLFKAHKELPGEELLKFEQQASTRVLRCKVNRDFEKFDQEVASIMEEFPNYQDTISLIKETDLYFNILAIYFELERYDQAQDWLVRILNHKRIQEREYLYIYTRSLELLILAELQHFRLLASRADAFYKYLHKREKMGSFEQAVYRFVKELIKHRDKIELKAAYQGFEKALREIDSEEYRKIANDTVDYLDWLSNKKLA